jgi:hypothetical protein
MGGVMRIRTVLSAAAACTLAAALACGLGDNTGWGGTNVSSFVFAGAVANATLAADGRVIIENGVLK